VFCYTELLGCWDGRRENIGTGIGFSQSVVVREKHNIAGSWQLVSEC